MGFTLSETRAMSINEFTVHYEGYQRRVEEKWDMVRHMMWATISFGGMGLKKPISVQDIIQLSRDKKEVKRYITNRAQALQLLTRFTNG